MLTMFVLVTLDVLVLENGGRSSLKSAQYIMLRGLVLAYMTRRTPVVCQPLETVATRASHEAARISTTEVLSSFWQFLFPSLFNSSLIPGRHYESNNATYYCSKSVRRPQNRRSQLSLEQRSESAYVAGGNIGNHFEKDATVHSRVRAPSFYFSLPVGWAVSRLVGAPIPLRRSSSV